MLLFRHYDGLPDAVRGAVAAVGNFDGIHRGHQAVIRAAADEARRRATPRLVLTFEPHPRRFFRPDDRPFRLTSFRTKARHLEALGVDALVVLHFDQALAETSAEDFVRRVIADGLGAAHVVVGYNFVFGHRRRGDTGLLARMATAAGFGFTAVQPVADADGELYSSTAIRDALGAGDPARAAALLGRPWEVEGRVEPGEHRGRRLGFPTANLALADFVQPRRGVYAVRAGVDQGERTVWHDGVANFGRRPTFDGGSVWFEVHLFGYSGDLYGAHLRVALIDFLRPERRFDGVDALKAQIGEDVDRARHALAATATAGAGGIRAQGLPALP
jgi:riboflavin kinase/FMN adenylyltransferase